VGPEQLVYVSAAVAAVAGVASWFVLFFQAYKRGQSLGKDARLAASVEKATTIAPAIFVVSLVAVYIVLTAASRFIAGA